MLTTYFPTNSHADVKFQIVRDGVSLTTDAWVKMLEKFNNIEFHALKVEEKPKINQLMAAGEGLDYRLFVAADNEIPTEEELANTTMEFVVSSNVAADQKAQILRALPKRLLEAGILEIPEYIRFEREMQQHFPIAHDKSAEKV